MILLVKEIRQVYYLQNLVPQHLAKVIETWSKNSEGNFLTEVESTVFSHT